MCMSGSCRTKCAVEKTPPVTVVLRVPGVQPAQWLRLWPDARVASRLLQCHGQETRTACAAEHVPRISIAHDVCSTGDAVAITRGDYMTLKCYGMLRYVRCGARSKTSPPTRVRGALRTKVVDQRGQRRLSGALRVTALRRRHSNVL